MTGLVFPDMQSMDRIAQFTEVYRNLNLFPLFKPAEIDRFCVTYGQQALGKLRRELAFAEDSGKLIFTAMGCGKSTLLGQLASQILEKDVFVLGFSIADMVEMSDVNHVHNFVKNGKPNHPTRQQSHSIKTSRLTTELNNVMPPFET